MAVQDIYGAGKGKVVIDVTAKINGVLGKDGFIIDQLTFNGALRLPENVAQAINRAMEATQNAIQAENRVRQVKAEADQAVAQARGGAEAARQRAQGDADAVLIRARSESRANEIIRLSTSGSVLQYRAIERWDGKLPMMQGGDKTPLLTFDVGKLMANDADREKKLHQLLNEEEAKEKAKREKALPDTVESAPSPAAPAAPSAAPAAPSAAPAANP